MTKAVVSSGGDGTGDGDRAYGFNIRGARDGVQAVSKVPLYKFLFSCLVFLSSLPCCRELLSFRRGLGQVRQFCCFWKSSSADIPVLWSLHPPISCSVVITIQLADVVSAPSFGGQGLPLFFLHFHDIDDHPAIRLLYSWLLCIIHRRSPAYSSISTPATTHSADAPDTLNSPHLTARVRRVSLSSHPIESHSHSL